MKFETASLPPILHGLLQKECETWSAAHPVSTSMIYGDELVTITSQAFVTPGALPVVHISGSRHYVPLSKLRAP